MGFAEFILILKSIKDIPKYLAQISEDLRELKREKINASLEDISKEVDAKIKLLEVAKNDDERKKAIIELKRSIGR